MYHYSTIGEFMLQDKLTSISAFFPCYNDEKTIGKLVSEVSRVLKGVAYNYEVIVIDDGSSDQSRKILKELKNKNKHLKLIFHRKNRGYGGALRSGFKAAKNDFIFYTDGDGQYDVKELPLLVNLMTRDVNFVNGIKMERRDYIYRIILGNMYNFIVRWAFLLPIFDTDCDFRLVRRSLLKKLTLKSTSGTICVELVKRAQRSGAKFRQVSIHHYERGFGQSQFFRPARLLKTFSELIPLWFELMVKNHK